MSAAAPENWAEQGLDVVETDGNERVQYSDPASSAAVARDPDDDPERVEGPNRQLLFPCEEEGCTKIFQRYKNWERHVAIGVHQRRPERQSLHDYAIDQYAKSIETGDLYKQYPTVVGALNEQSLLDQSTMSDEYALNVGWALKGGRKRGGFTSDQKLYLTQLYLEGARTNRKYDPKTIVKEMRQVTREDGSLRFEKQHWLKWTQVPNSHIIYCF